MLAAGWISFGTALRASFGARWAPLVVSSALHGGALLFVGHSLMLPGTSAVIEPEVAVDTLSDFVEPPLSSVEEAAATSGAAGAPRQHHHSYPVPPNHDATPHDPALKHLPVSLPNPAAPSREAEPALALPATTASATAPNEAAAIAPPRFSLRAPATRFEATGTPRVGSSTASVAAADSTVFSEREVDEPARLRSTTSVVYPEAARAASLEADVAVEIVVDASGKVISARALSAPGYGLEQAALVAVRGYRFSPARRAGQPVRVRLRATVAFQLR